MTNKILGCVLASALSLSAFAGTITQQKPLEIGQNMVFNPFPYSLSDYNLVTTMSVEYSVFVNVTAVNNTDTYQNFYLNFGNDLNMTVFGPDMFNVHVPFTASFATGLSSNTVLHANLCIGGSSWAGTVSNSPFTVNQFDSVNVYASDILSFQEYEGIDIFCDPPIVEGTVTLTYDYMPVPATSVLSIAGMSVLGFSRRRR